MQLMNLLIIYVDKMINLPKGKVNISRTKIEKPKKKYYYNEY